MEVLDLNGKKGLVVGIANEDSLAWWVAQHFRNAGAELAITYFNDKARPHVEPLARRLGALLLLGPLPGCLPDRAGKECTRHRAAARGDTQKRRLTCEPS